MYKKPSLKDIATRVGVSTALVSYVLNNKKEGRIGKEVTAKIKDVAKELNYHTNQIAKSLKTNKTYTIGLVVADISNPFFSALARIIEDEADKLNYTVIFGSSDENAQKFRKVLDILLNRQVDGLIISPPRNSENEIKYLLQQGIPFVLADRYFPALSTNYVALDNYDASYTAGQHIIAGGKKRIGMINYDTDLFHICERERGYKNSLADNQIAFEEGWLKKVNINNIKTEITKSVDELLSATKPVDAILFGSNNIAVFGVKHINTLPVKVPGDLAIVSFDETTSLDLFYAPLTFIRQPLEEIGRIATQLLLDNINDHNKTVKGLKVKAQLVVQASTSS